MWSSGKQAACQIGENLILRSSEQVQAGAHRGYPSKEPFLRDIFLLSCFSLKRWFLESQIKSKSRLCTYLVWIIRAYLVRRMQFCSGLFFLSFCFFPNRPRVGGGGFWRRGCVAPSRTAGGWQWAFLTDSSALLSPRRACLCFQTQTYNCWIESKLIFSVFIIIQSYHCHATSSLGKALDLKTKCSETCKWK